MSNSSQILEHYNTKLTTRQLISFGAMFIIETIGRRRISRLMRCQIGRAKVEVSGVDNVPDKGSFTFASNHFRGGLSMAVISALMNASVNKRPDLSDDFLLVVGHRVNSRAKGIAVSIIRKIMGRLRTRWADSILHIPIGNERPSINFLREWRERCRQQPVIIFPEGVASLEFKSVREGAGRWLSSCPTPTIPVGVWWHKDKWHVRFGPPVEWSIRSELRDVQLGLSIAALLPEDLAGTWQEDLRRWRSAHDFEESPPVERFRNLSESAESLATVA